MNPIEDWLVDFMERHRMRFAPHDWPEQGTEENDLFLGVWLHAFRQIGVSEQDAEEASIGLGLKPPRFRSDHLPAIIAGVREIEDRRRAERQERESAAWHESKAKVVATTPEPKPPGVMDWRRDWKKFVAKLAERTRIERD